MGTLEWLGVISVIIVLYIAFLVIRSQAKDRQAKRRESERKAAAEEAAFLKRLAPVLIDIKRLPLGQVSYQPPPLPVFVGVWIFKPQPRRVFTPNAGAIEKAAYHYLKAMEAGKIGKQTFNTQSQLFVFVDNHVKRLL